MHRLACGLRVDGFVRNERDSVWLEVEGAADAVARFLSAVHVAAPPAARIESVEVSRLPPRFEAGFRIEPSQADLRGDVVAAIPADLAPCDACLRELADPRDRRHRYPFINCTACGPRFTIVRAVPYDRARTTMDAFALCHACRAEYEDPTHRRFHAEPNACPACGPQLRWLADGEPSLTGDAALLCAARAITAGRIVAVKGAGGFLLACDARDERAVSLLRLRKRRPHRPLAVMAQSLAHAEGIAVLSAEARRALLSPARPIVLAPRRRGAELAPSVAPGLEEIGVFLPPTPLQHLLLESGPPLQVMTSGNLSEEPIAKDNDEALRRLRAVADAFLLHDRDIHTRADDSVVRSMGGGITPVRRGRGLAPEPIALLARGPPLLAVGGELKSTVCVAKGGQAFVSQHIGDLRHPDTYAFFQEVIRHLSELLDAEPQAVAHDLHPDYRATRWAQERGLPLVPVQHHHAHVAACLAEHGLTGPVLGVVFDGTGYGPDGALWGGEVLEADLGRFSRRGHLRPIRLPGGEAAIREPWRLALAALVDAGEASDLLPFVDVDKRRAVERLVDKRLSSPPAAGAGRWFDAVAALCGVRHDISYDGQAAVELEARATTGSHSPYAFALEQRRGAPFAVDLRPMIRGVAHDLRSHADVGDVAARFHETLARVVLEGCRRARADGGPNVVALTGGCFVNRRLTERSRALLWEHGFEVLLHRRAPPGDGGLSLGQAAVASWRLNGGGR